MPYYNPNPYTNLYYPGVYQNSTMPGYGQQMAMPQSYAPGPSCAMAWVDGEIEARGRQMPQGVTQYAMWDTNRQVIYLKSLNQMGMPNPMQIIRYTIDEQQQSALPAAESRESNISGENRSGNEENYVTKQDFEQLRNEIRNMSRSYAQSMAQNNQNGSNSGNRGGNK